MSYGATLSLASRWQGVRKVLRETHRGLVQRGRHVLDEEGRCQTCYLVLYPDAQPAPPVTTVTTVTHDGQLSLEFETVGSPR